MDPGRRVRRVALVGDSNSQRDRLSAAADLFVSPLFRLSRTWAESHCDAWYILSAEHGLLSPRAPIRPYPETLAASSAERRRDWSRRVREQMRGAGLLSPDVIVVWLAGRAYKDDLDPLLADQVREDPLEGLGIGERRRWLASRVGGPAGGGPAS